MGTIGRMRREGVFKSIIVGTDGSARAEDAVREGARLASMTEAPLGILYVIDTGRPRDQGDEPLPEEAIAKAKVLAEQTGVRVDARIVSGDPAMMLMEVAGEQGADLLCVGPDAGLTFGPPRIGRVASRVLGEAPCSVLVSRSVEPNPLSHIVCGIDGSAISADLAAIAIAVAHVAGAEIQLLHVIGRFWRRVPKRTLLMATAGERSRASTEPARAHEVVPPLTVERGRPGPTLIETATRQGSDLLVVGRRDVGVQRTLLGSVSEYCAYNAPCSVLVARPTAGGRTNVSR